MNDIEPPSRDEADRNQSCNECRRRKARCDKTLPVCGPCRKNRRHCLYERHSKTPLTRRYLTEVEEELRRARAEATRAIERASQAEARVRQLELRSNDAPDARRAGDGVQRDMPPVDDIVVAPLEAPPSARTDFSWDEQSAEPGQIENGGVQPATLLSQDDDERIADGMASLSVDEREAGYLGVASGAAMLRLLLPDSHHASKKSPANGSIHTTTGPVGGAWLETPLWDVLDLGAIDLDKAIDAYFALYHNSYPLVEEHTFRAQYAQVIPRPSGRSWHALVFMVAALGHFTTAMAPTDVDRRLFMAAKSNLSIESMEMGNITLVQALTLMSNYLQKRNKPNSGYNYLGLALHMAIGLGLHKEFDGWNISPLNLEIRRRVWWSIFVFNIGAAVTFGRPLAWPNKNVEVRLPLNVADRSLTNLSCTSPIEADHVTTFSAVVMQSKFHLLTNDIYTRIISMPFPSAAELIRLDDTMIAEWESSVPVWYREDATIPTQLMTGHAIMFWRLRNFRIIMYRPYVIRRVLQARSQPEQIDVSPEVQESYHRCLREAEASIQAISLFWASTLPTMMSAWYSLYFLFQASLIPCVCLRNEPRSTLANGWRDQITQTLHTIQSIARLNSSAQDCYDVLQRLCGPYLHHLVDFGTGEVGSPLDAGFDSCPTEESPQTQINNVYSMIWPNAHDPEADMAMQESIWAELCSSTADEFVSGNMSTFNDTSNT